MVTHPSPVSQGTAVVVSMAGGRISRWLDPNDPAGGTGWDDAPPRRPCSSYRPGHCVHLIQANRGLRTPSRAFVLLEVDGDELVVAADGSVMRWWVHDAEFARAALLLDVRPVIDLHGYGLARLGSALFYPHVKPGERPPGCA